MTIPSAFRVFPALLAALLSLGAAAIPFPALTQKYSTSAETTSETNDTSAAILAGARSQAQKAVPYIMNYEVIKYPGGDVAEGTGVCTDLVVRAFRHAGIDLQKEIQTDRKARLSAYPDIWDKRAADRNIDHRRCPNLVALLKKDAINLSTETTREKLTDWQGGTSCFMFARGQLIPGTSALFPTSATLMACRLS